MSRIQSLRLAQFWRTRIEPLGAPRNDGQRVFTSQVFEAVGWLMEGVFCGAFDVEEADIVWTRFKPTVETCEAPEYSMVSEALMLRVRRLLESPSPFRQVEQMTEGPQKRFELPLFPQALLIGDRLATDGLASHCVALLYSLSEEEWQTWKESWPADIENAFVVDELKAPSPENLWPSVFSGEQVGEIVRKRYAARLDTAVLLASYLR